MKRLLIPQTQSNPIRLKNYSAWYVLDCPVEWRWFRPYKTRHGDYLEEGVSLHRYVGIKTVIIEDPMK